MLCDNENVAILLETVNDSRRLIIFGSQLESIAAFIVRLMVEPGIQWDRVSAYHTSFTLINKRKRIAVSEISNTHIESQITTTKQFAVTSMQINQTKIIKIDIDAIHDKIENHLNKSL